MGLAVSHNCWWGSYSSFHRFRQALAVLIGMRLDRMEGFCPDGIRWRDLAPDPIYTLLAHSDCDGEIATADCVPLANRLLELLPAMRTADRFRAAAAERDRNPECDEWAPRVEQFAQGLLDAAACGEAVEFR